MHPQGIRPVVPDLAGVRSSGMFRIDNPKCKFCIGQGAAVPNSEVGGAEAS